MGRPASSRVMAAHIAVGGDFIGPMGPSTCSALGSSWWRRSRPDRHQRRAPGMRRGATRISNFRPARAAAASRAMALSRLREIEASVAGTRSMGSAPRYRASTVAPHQMRKPEGRTIGRRIQRHAFLFQQGGGFLGELGLPRFTSAVTRIDDLGKRRCWSAWLDLRQIGDPGRLRPIVSTLAFALARMRRGQAARLAPFQRIEIILRGQQRGC